MLVCRMSPDGLSVDSVPSDQLTIVRPTGYPPRRLVPGEEVTLPSGGVLTVAGPQLPNGSYRCSWDVPGRTGIEEFPAEALWPIRASN